MSEFQFMETVPVGLTSAQRRQQEIDAWKEQWGAWTTFSEGVDQPWLAILTKKAHKRLSGYSLTAEELSEPVLLFAGYCRLLDEYGLSAEAETEEEACLMLSKRWGFVQP